ncbi:MAG: GntR family transcriptional regulator [Pseudorhodobacter sp.]|nr:GntR family transcriptional regulator [Rhizobacter sp.]
MVDPTPLRPASLYEEVATRLRSMVFDRALAPGQWVDELALARDWQISRTPLREALKVLASEGLVTLVPRQGCRVTEVSEDDAAQLFPVMALLEGRCAFEAVTKATPVDVKALRRLHDNLEKHAAAHNIDGYYRANHEFHTKVQALADNRWLDRATNDLRSFLRLLRGRQLNWPGRVEESIEEHRRLMEAIDRRDAALAGRLMHDHLLAQLSALNALRSHEKSHRGQHA